MRGEKIIDAVDSFTSRYQCAFSFFFWNYTHLVLGNSAYARLLYARSTASCATTVLAFSTCKASLCALVWDQSVRIDDSCLVL
jgi:hypothetical protein